MCVETVHGRQNARVVKGLQVLYVTFKLVGEGISAKSLGKWRAAMSPRDIAVFQDIAGEMLEHWNYELSDQIPDPGFHRTLYPVYRTADIAQRILQWWWLHGYRERGREIPELLRRNWQRLSPPKSEIFSQPAGPAPIFFPIGSRTP